jgi:ribosomal protein S18 acetylase RimI-like enzyme
MIELLSIVRLENEADAWRCADLMATSEPWLTLRRDRDSAYAAITSASRETYVGLIDGDVVGFLILCMEGAFVGYIQSICVARAHRNRGIGSRMLSFAEERILAAVPNVFLCVSSFNEGAKRLYGRLGYEVIGELRDYVVEGHSEILLRKTAGPLSRGLGQA